MSIGSGNVRLLFYTNGSAIVPRAASNGSANGTIDLGNSGNRFKDLHLSGAVNAAGFQSNQTTTGFGYINFGDTDDANIGQIGYDHTDNYMRFQVNNTEKVRIDSSGRLLINTTSSIDNNAKLQILGDSSSYARITLKDVDGTNQYTYFQQSGGGTAISTQNGTSNGNFDITGWNGSTTSYFFRITSSGRVGIGTTNPATNLQVYDSSSHSEIRISSSSSSNSTVPALSLNNTGVEWSMGILADNHLHFRENSASYTSRMTIADGGNVGINQTNPTAKLHVDGSLIVTGTSTLGVVDATSFTDVITNTIYTASGSLDIDTVLTSRDVTFTQGSTNLMTVKGTGNVGIGTSSPRYNLAVQGNNATAIGIALDNTSGSGTADLAILGASYNSHQAGPGEFWLYSPDNINIGGATGNTNNIKFLANNSVNMFIQGSNGNIGIGTTSPSQALHVVGKIYTSGTGGSGYFEGHRLILEGTGTYANIGGSAYQISNVTNEGLAFGRASSRMMLLDTSGNLGIGTTSPSEKLEVSGGNIKITNASGGSYFKAVQTSNNANAGYYMASGSSIWYTLVDTAGRYQIYDGDAAQTRIIVDGTGRVGIGTISPGTKLDVTTIANTAGIRVTAPNTTSQSFGVTIAAGTNSSDYAFNINNAAGGGILRVRGDGRVGIGNTSPDEKFHVTGNIKLTGAIVDSYGEQLSFQLNDLVSFSKHIRAEFGLWARSATARAMGIDGPANGTYMGLYTNTTEKVRIDSSGNVGISTTSPSTFTNYTNVSIKGGSAGVNLDFHNASGARRAALVASDAGLIVETNTTAIPIMFKTGATPTERLRIASNYPYLFLGHTGHSWGTFDAVAQIGRTGFIANYDGTGTSNQQTVIANNTYYGGSGYTSIEAATGAAYINLNSGKVSFFTAPATTAGAAQTFTQRLTLTNAGNVGIGTASPNAKLEIKGASSVNYLKFIDSSSTELFRINSNFTWAWGTAAPDNLAFDMRDNSGNAFFALNRSNSRVGIGTTSPQALLHLNSASDTYFILGTTNSTADGRIQFRNSGGSDVGGLWYNTSGNRMMIRTNSAERMRIDSSGELTLGNPSGGSALQLDVSATGTDGVDIKSTYYSGGYGPMKFKTSGSTRLTLETNGNSVFQGNNHTNLQVKAGDNSVNAFLQTVQGADARFGTSSNHQLNIATNGVFRLSIKNTGQVGIGTSDPAKLLTLAETADGTKLRLNRGGVSEWDFSIGNTSIMTGVGSGALEILAQNSGTARELAIGSVSGGAPLVHVTTSATTFSQGAVFNEAGADSDFRVESNNDQNAIFLDAGNDIIYFGATAANTGTDFCRIDARPGQTGHVIITGRDDASTKNHHVFTNPNGTVGSIQTAGSATAYNTSSDERLKKNIQDAADAGSKIDAIKVRQFDWKVDDSHQDYGMVAQELQPVAPEAVWEPESADEMKGVDYSKLVPMLVKEIQSLRARVAELEGE
jgi:hypothetical protein